LKYAWAFLAAAIAFGSHAEAAEVGPCNQLDAISILVGQTRSFSGGKIRIAHVDTDGEPVCCSSHLLVFVIDPSPEVGIRCFAVSQQAAKGDQSALGFSSLDLRRVRASYDPQRGLLLTVPYALYELDKRGGRPGAVGVRVNLGDKGSVVIER
jgi:hypothetical protein